MSCSSSNKMYGGSCLSCGNMGDMTGGTCSMCKFGKLLQLGNVPK